MKYALEVAVTAFVGWTAVAGDASAADAGPTVMQTVTSPFDLTVTEYSGVQPFHDGEVCGSDCARGMSPAGLTCTGENAP
jgi:hypothetical protein